MPLADATTIETLSALALWLVLWMALDAHTRLSRALPRSARGELKALSSFVGGCGIWAGLCLPALVQGAAPEPLSAALSLSASCCFMSVLLAVCQMPAPRWALLPVVYLTAILAIVPLSGSSPVAAMGRHWPELLGCALAIACAPLLVLWVLARPRPDSPGGAAALGSPPTTSGAVTPYRRVDTLCQVCAALLVAMAVGRARELLAPLPSLSLSSVPPAVLTAACVVAFGVAIALWLAAGWATRQARISAQETADRLSGLAHLDTLTGVSNRRGLERRMAQLQQSPWLAVLYLDLDGFKPVNDTLGHAAGDELLRVIAARLEAVAGSGTVARMGGDEFVILLDSALTGVASSAAPAAERAAALAQAIVQEVSAPVALGRREVVVSASVGYALSPADGPVTGLLECADAAMYRAKRSGKNQACRFDAKLDREGSEQSVLLRDLRAALHGGEFTLFVQGRRDARTLELLSVEALVRWVSPDRRVRQPEEFLDAIHKAGLSAQLTQVVLEQACALAQALEGTHPHLRLSLNLSGVEVRDPQFLARVDSVLGNRTAQIGFEMPESYFERFADSALAVCRGLSERGYMLSVDGYGTGNLGWGALRMLPLQQVLLSEDLLGDAMLEPSSLESVIALCVLLKSYGLRVLAKGVSDANRLELARLACVDGVQGYFFEKPSALADARWLGPLCSQVDCHQKGALDAAPCSSREPLQGSAG